MEQHVPLIVNLLHCFSVGAFRAQPACEGHKAVLPSEGPKDSCGRRKCDLDFPDINEVRIAPRSQAFEKLLVVLNAFSGDVAFESRPHLGKIIQLVRRVAIQPVLHVL